MCIRDRLYENTGLSRHFPVHFGRDIMDCRTIEDFEAFSWTGDDTEGRRHRVYQQLTLTPGFYCSDETRGDYEYVKNQRRAIDASLDQAMDGELQIHKNGAFFLLSEDVYKRQPPSRIPASRARSSNLRTASFSICCPRLPSKWSG